MSTENLQKIQKEEQAIDDVLVKKILGALKDGAKLRRQLARLTHLKVATIDLVIRSLEAQDKVKVVTIKNSSGGKPTVYISPVTPSEQEKERCKEAQLEELRQRRYTLMDIILCACLKRKADEYCHTKQNFVIFHFITYYCLNRLLRLS